VTFGFLAFVIFVAFSFLAFAVFSLLTFVWLWCGFGFLAFWFLRFLISCFGLFSLNFLALVVPAYTLFQVRQEQINIQNAAKSKGQAPESCF
jgi:hypothetical protein